MSHNPFYLISIPHVYYIVSFSLLLLPLFVVMWCVEIWCFVPPLLSERDQPDLLSRSTLLSQFLSHRNWTVNYITKFCRALLLIILVIRAFDLPAQSLWITSIKLILRLLAELIQHITSVTKERYSIIHLQYYRYVFTTCAGRCPIDHYRDLIHQGWG